MLSDNKQKDVTGTVFRGLILYLGLIMAIFYGLKGEWGAALIGVLAAAVAFFLKGKKENSSSP